MKREENIFVYGTLMYERVCRAVCGCKPDFTDAVLCGYRRCAVVGKPYPVVVESPEDFVEGKLWRGIPKKALRFLDIFEDVSRGYYTKRKLEIVTGEGVRHQAWVYTVGPKLSKRLGGEWSEERFRSEYLAKYYEEVSSPFDRVKS